MSGAEPNPFVLGLRREFDDAFARPRADRPAEGDPHVALGVGEISLALPLAELASLDAGRTIETVPAGTPALLGLAGLKGRLVAAFDLGALLGAPRAGAPPRWLATIRRAPTVALAFERFEGRFDAAAPAAAPGGAAPRLPFVSHHVRDGSTLRAVLDLDAVLSSLERAAGDPRERLPEEPR